MKRIVSTLAGLFGLGLLAVAVAPSGADAISRYTSTAMSCAAIKSAVANEGAVILRWTSKKTGNTLYDRYVKSSGYCDPNERAVSASVPSADRASCNVKKCKRCEVDRDGRFFGLRLRCW